MAMEFPLKRTKLTLQDIRKAQILDNKPIGKLTFDEFCLVEHVIYNATQETTVPIPEAIKTKIILINSRRARFAVDFAFAQTNLDFTLTGLLPVGYLKPQ